MNWGLFLALIGFLLPISLMLRVAVQLWLAGEPLLSPIQAMRLILLLLLAVPVTGKVPVTLYATTGHYDALGHVTEAFMVTGWGLAQSTFMLTAVIGCDLFAPRIVRGLHEHPGPEPSHPIVYLVRDFGVFAICLLLAWFAAR